MATMDSARKIKQLEGGFVVGSWCLDLKRKTSSWCNFSSAFEDVAKKEMRPGSWDPHRGRFTELLAEPETTSIQHGSLLSTEWHETGRSERKLFHWQIHTFCNPSKSALFTSIPLQLYPPIANMAWCRCCEEVKTLLYTWDLTASKRSSLDLGMLVFGQGAPISYRYAWVINSLL